MNRDVRQQGNSTHRAQKARRMKRMNMTLALKFGTGFLAGAISLGSVGRAQEKPTGQDKKPEPGMSMQEPMQHQHGDVPLVKPEYPQMGRAQERAGAQVVTLEQAEKMAAETNPTLRQAEAEIRAAKARQQQAGLAGRADRRQARAPAPAGLPHPHPPARRPAQGLH